MRIKLCICKKAYSPSIALLAKTNVECRMENQNDIEIEDGVSSFTIT